MTDGATDPSTALAHERTHLADERTRLAITRTLIALDRTLIAWVRTTTALISFGFTIYKFFDYMAQRPQVSHRLLTPRNVALVLIGIGVASLIGATLEYRNQTRSLRTRYSHYGPFNRPLAPSVATIISGLGVLAFVLIFLRQ